MQDPLFDEKTRSELLAKLGQLLDDPVHRPVIQERARRLQKRLKAFCQNNGCTVCGAAEPVVAFLGSNDLKRIGIPPDAAEAGGLAAFPVCAGNRHDQAAIDAAVFIAWAGGNFQQFNPE